ncbi:MAG: DUF2802 domain-containing protein [Pseudomonadota bacterium]|jgi:hypothetical protein|nr:DUF2802 domain-containing protein [Xanthomonadaceae bacterium]MDE3210792.1 DUF2802 domain-containing protein [Pseudomonadota bacterium]
MWLELGIGLVLALLLLQSALLLQLWRRVGQLQAALRALPTGTGTPHDYTDVPTSLLVTVLGRLERRLSEAEQRPPPAAPGVSYELAQKLAREGADVEQLISRCGLSRDEAVLVLQLHPASH